MKRLWRFDMRPEAHGMAPLKIELAAELGIPRPRNGALIHLRGESPIAFSRVEVDGIIDRSEQYRPREPGPNPEMTGSQN